MRVSYDADCSDDDSNSVPSVLEYQQQSESYVSKLRNNMRNRIKNRSLMNNNKENVSNNNNNNNGSNSSNIIRNSEVSYQFYYERWKKNQTNICTKSKCIGTSANGNKINIAANYPGKIIVANNIFYIKFAGKNILYVVDAKHIEYSYVILFVLHFCNVFNSVYVLFR